MQTALTLLSPYILIDKPTRPYLLTLAHTARIITEDEGREITDRANAILEDTVKRYKTPILLNPYLYPGLRSL